MGSRRERRTTTDKLQRVLNSAARIVSNTRKFHRALTHFRRSQLHWLDVVDRVRFRVCVQVFRCLHKMVLEYLSTYCQPVSGICYYYNDVLWSGRQVCCDWFICQTTNWSWGRERVSQSAPSAGRLL